MATQNEDKDMHGRKYDQLTRDGTSSAGSMGTDSTGDQRGQGGTGSGQQSGTRTDDLLTDGSDADQQGGFTSAESAGELQTGMGGIGSLSGSGAGNRQSGTQPGGESGAMNTADSKAGGCKEESGGQRIGTREGTQG